MKNDVFAKLQYCNIDVEIFSVYDMIFENGNEVNCLRSGRQGNLVYFITSGEREYEIDGRVFTVGAGTTVFIPEGTCYRTVARDKLSEHCGGVGFVFYMSEGHPVIQKDVYCIALNLEESFMEISRINQKIPLPYSLLKSKLYGILHCLFSDEEYGIIKPAVDFITGNFSRNIPVKEYARKCNLSESYFRKLFSEKTGMSPIDFRNHIRLKEAEKLYRQGFSVQEIAERVGFCDGVYLMKLYKRYKGTTLKKAQKYFE